MSEHSNGRPTITKVVPLETVTVYNYKDRAKQGPSSKKSGSTPAVQALEARVNQTTQRVKTESVSPAGHIPGTSYLTGERSLRKSEVAKAWQNITPLNSRDYS